MAPQIKQRPHWAPSILLSQDKMQNYKKPGQWAVEYHRLFNLIIDKGAIENKLIMPAAKEPLLGFFFMVSHDDEVQRWLVRSDGSLVEGRMLNVLGYLAREDRFCFRNLMQLAHYLYRRSALRCYTSPQSIRVYLQHDPPADILPRLALYLK